MRERIVETTCIFENMPLPTLGWMHVVYKMGDVLILLIPIINGYSIIGSDADDQHLTS